MVSRYYADMGKTNRMAALESKLVQLLGEEKDVRVAIERSERLVAELPEKRQRLREIAELIRACELVVTSDHPEWTRGHLKPKRRFTHKIPVRLGQAIKIALDVLREAETPMTIREISCEVLFREGHDAPDADTITKVANNIGNQFRKGNRPYLDNDGEWPAHWRVKNAG